MAQLGNRLLAYEIAGVEATEAELIEFAENYETNDAVQECRRVVNDFLQAYFSRHPPNSVDPQATKIDRTMQEEVVRYAKLIANGRMEVLEGETTLPEDPRRVILLLQTLIRGLALADDRMSVDENDLRIVRHIAFSSIPSKRRELLRAVLTAGGTMNAGEIDEALDLSRPTTLRRMNDLGGTGIVEFYPGESAASKPAQISLSREFTWLLPTPFKESRGERNERRDYKRYVRTQREIALRGERPPQT